MIRQICRSKDCTKPKMNTEESEQRKLVKDLFKLERVGKIVHFHATANETKITGKSKAHSLYVGQKLKALGKRAGISDLTIHLKDKALYIELKRQKKVLKSGKLSQENLASKEQLEFINRMNSLPYADARVCYGYDEAIKFVMERI